MSIGLELPKQGFKPLGQSRFNGRRKHPSDAFHQSHGPRSSSWVALRGRVVSRGADSDGADLEKLLLIHPFLPMGVLSGGGNGERHSGQGCVCHFSCVQLSPTPWTAAHPWLLCPWDFPGKSSGVGCHYFLPTHPKKNSNTEIRWGQAVEEIQRLQPIQGWWTTGVAGSLDWECPPHPSDQSEVCKALERSISISADTSQRHTQPQMAHSQHYPARRPGTPG